MDPLDIIFLAPPVGIFMGLVFFPWRRPDARSGWPFLVSLLIPPAICFVIGILFAAPAGYRDIPAGLAALIWGCTAGSLALGIYLVAFRLKDMRLSASMFAMAGIAVQLIAQLVAAMSVTANWI
jgi:hypothetical protein